jgi:hypothetical protein
MPNAYAVVVEIEQYQQSGMEGVDYAHADARDFVDVLVERIDVPKENVDLWLDQDATDSRFENDLKYNVSRLGRDDRFYFFYAGHVLCRSRLLGDQRWEPADGLGNASPVQGSSRTINSR